jgi:hypothetical protein
MKDWTDLIALNVAWLTWQLASWTDVVDWALSVVGAVTLIWLNVLKLRRQYERRDVNN